MNEPKMSVTLTYSQDKTIHAVSLTLCIESYPAVEV